MNRNTKKAFEHFVGNFKRPIFILGIMSWIALFIVISTESFSITKTGYAISNTVTLGLTGAQFVVFIFVVLSILMFIVWKYVVSDLRKAKNPKKR